MKIILILHMLQDMHNLTYPTIDSVLLSNHFSAKKTFYIINPKMLYA